MAICLRLSTDIPPTLSDMQEFLRVAQSLGVNSGVVHIADITKEDGSLEVNISWGPVVELVDYARRAQHAADQDLGIAGRGSP